MTPEFVIQIVREALTTTCWIAAPVLLAGFIAGILISLVQIVTSIQDSAFNTVPRLVAFLVAIVLLMPWMLHRTMAYTAGILGDLGRYAR
jgi:flagellar biosynthesis protein FliQ